MEMNLNRKDFLKLSSIVTAAAAIMPKEVMSLFETPIEILETAGNGGFLISDWMLTDIINTLESVKAVWRNEDEPVPLAPPAPVFGHVEFTHTSGKKFIIPSLGKVDPNDERQREVLAKILSRHSLG